MRFRPGPSLCRLLLVLAVCLVCVNLLGLGLRYPGLLLILIGFVAWKRINGQEPGDSHGSARASGFGELWRHRLLGSEGLIMGTGGYIEPPGWKEAVRALFSPLPPRLACQLFLAGFLGRRWSDDTVIRIKDYVHIGTFAPTGSGKGVSALIPNLLSIESSCVINDPQGSLFAASAAHRKSSFGHRIVRLDCFAVCGESRDGLNVLDFLDVNSPDFLDQCRDLANMLVVRTGEEHDPHWNDRAEQVLTAAIVFVKAMEPDPAHCTLLTVRALVSSMDAFLAMVNTMRQIPGFGGVVKRQGDSLTSLKDKELHGVMSTVQRHTAWMDSPAVARYLSRSTFDPRELRGGRMSIYLILPPERLVTMAPLLRVTLGTIIRVITRGKASEKNPVLFLIDECAHLGRVQVLEDSITLMRGYGIRLWLYFQSTKQLDEVYGSKAPTILENLRTQQYFCVNGYDSLEHLSKTIGDCTIVLTSINKTTGSSHPTGGSPGQPQSGSESTSTAVTTSQTGRRWAKPEEIRTMPADLALVLHKNLHVIPTKLLRHYDSPLFKDGGTGRSPGLGLAGGMAACAALAISLLLSIAVSRLPAAHRPRMAAATPMSPASPPPPALRASSQNGPAQRPVSRRQRPRRPGPSGYLIRVP